MYEVTKGITTMGISERFARRTGSAPRTGVRGIGKGRQLFGGIAVAAAGALGATALAGCGSAIHVSNSASSSLAAAAAGGYKFATIGSTKDRTFNQLLGINNSERIAAYFGSGAIGHPNKGYTITTPYAQGDIKSENFPGSVQTQVTGLNDDSVQVGFFSTQNTKSLSNNNFGWYDAANGSFHKVVYPTGNNANPQVDQLLGVNDHDIAVGFYNNSGGSARGYEYNINNGRFSLVTEPGAPAGGKAPSLTAAAINNLGDVAGFYTTAGGTVDAFLKLASGRFITITVPGASATNAFGVNDSDTVAGTYTVGTGTAAKTNGFTWRGGRLTTKIDDPSGVGTTFLNVSTTRATSSASTPTRPATRTACSPSPPPRPTAS